MMQPIRINLKKKKDLKRKLVLMSTLLFISFAIGLTVSNIFNYISNLKTIEDYEDRLEQVKGELEQHRRTVRSKNKAIPDNTDERAGQLTFVLKKHLTSLPALLTELERLKPEKVVINTINYDHTEKGHTVILNGASNYIEAVQLFIDRMNTSPRFLSALMQGRMNDHHKIEFTLTATWINDTAI